MKAPFRKRQLLVSIPAAAAEIGPTAVSVEDVDAVADATVTAGLIHPASKVGSEHVPMRHARLSRRQRCLRQALRSSLRRTKKLARALPALMAAAAGGDGVAAVADAGQDSRGTGRRLAPLRL